MPAWLRLRWSALRSIRVLSPSRNVFCPGMRVGMPPSNGDTRTVDFERHVSDAAQLLGLAIRPEWIPAIAQNFQLLLNAAKVSEIPGANKADQISRFEP
ncbi:MAG: DUF4089 domain-containing protein [Pseudolabrys sp.]